MKKLLPLFLFLLLAACSDDDSPKKGDPTPDDIHIMDITDARALLVTERGGTRAGTDGRAIFKVLDNGVVEEVNAYDESGRLISSEVIHPLAVYETPSEFVIFEFSGHRYAFASRNSGEVHVLTLPQIGGVYFFGRYGSGIDDLTFSTDSWQNLYMLLGRNMDGKSSVYRVNRAKMILEQLTPEVYDVLMYRNDNLGNLAFLSDKGFMMRSADGVFAEPEGWDISPTGFWVDGKGGFKAVAVERDTEESVPRFVELSIAEGKVKVLGLGVPPEAMLLAAASDTRFMIEGTLYYRGAYDNVTAILNCTANTYDAVPRPLSYVYGNGLPFKATQGHYTLSVDQGKVVLSGWSPYAEIDELYVYWAQPDNTDYIKGSVGKDGTAYINLFSRADASHVLYRVDRQGTVEILSNEAFSNMVELTAVN